MCRLEAMRWMSIVEYQQSSYEYFVAFSLPCAIVNAEVNKDVRG